MLTQHHTLPPFQRHTPRDTEGYTHAVSPHSHRHNYTNYHTWLQYHATKTICPPWRHTIITAQMPSPVSQSQPHSHPQEQGVQSHIHNRDTSSYHPHSRKDPTPQHTVSRMVTQTQPDLHPGDRRPQSHTHSHPPLNTQLQRLILNQGSSTRSRQRAQTRRSGHAPSPPRTPRPLTFCLPLVASGSLRS